MVIMGITMCGIIFAIFQEPVALIPHYTPMSQVSNWDPKDLNTVVTAIAFAARGVRPILHRLLDARQRRRHGCEGRPHHRSPASRDHTGLRDAAQGVSEVDRPHPVTQVLMLLVTLTYIVMALGYLYLNRAQLGALIFG